MTTEEINEDFVFYFPGTKLKINFKILILFFIVNFIFTAIYYSNWHLIHGENEKSWTNAIYLAVTTGTTLGYHLRPIDDAFIRWVSILQQLMNLSGLIIVFGGLYNGISSLHGKGPGDGPGNTNNRGDKGGNSDFQKKLIEDLGDLLNKNIEAIQELRGINNKKNRVYITNINYEHDHLDSTIDELVAELGKKEKMTNKEKKIITRLLRVKALLNKV